MGKKKSQTEEKNKRYTGLKKKIKQKKKQLKKQGSN